MIPPYFASSNTEIKISQVADDTTIFTGDSESTFEVIDTINKFSRVSGLKLNMSKTEGIWFQSDDIPPDRIDIHGQKILLNLLEYILE